MEWGERFFNQPRMFLDFYLPERMQLDDGTHGVRRGLPGAP